MDKAVKTIFAANAALMTASYLLTPAIVNHEFTMKQVMDSVAMGAVVSPLVMAAVGGSIGFSMGVVGKMVDIITSGKKALNFSGPILDDTRRSEHAGMVIGAYFGTVIGGMASCMVSATMGLGVPNLPNELRENGLKGFKILAQPDEVSAFNQSAEEIAAASSKTVTWHQAQQALVLS